MDRPFKPGDTVAVRIGDRWKYDGVISSKVGSMSCSDCTHWWVLTVIGYIQADESDLAHRDTYSEGG